MPVGVGEGDDIAHGEGAAAGVDERFDTVAATRIATEDGDRPAIIGERNSKLAMPAAHIQQRATRHAAE